MSVSYVHPGRPVTCGACGKPGAKVLNGRAVCRPACALVKARAMEKIRLTAANPVFVIRLGSAS